MYSSRRSGSAKIALMCCCCIGVVRVRQASKNSRCRKVAGNSALVAAVPLRRACIQVESASRCAKGCIVPGVRYQAVKCIVSAQCISYESVRIPVGVLRVARESWQRSLMPMRRKSCLNRCATRISSRSSMRSDCCRRHSVRLRPCIMWRSAAMSSATADVQEISVLQLVRSAAAACSVEC